MKTQSEEESKKIVQRKRNKKSERKQKRTIGKLAGQSRGGGWCQEGTERLG